MKKMFTKGLGIGLGIGLSIYLAGLLIDYKEVASKESERETFGTGN